MLQKSLTYLKKPLALVLIIMVAGTLLLSGCAKSSGANSASGGQVTLKFISNAGQYQVDQYGYKRIQEFMKANPNIKVDIIDVGNSFDDTFLSLAQSNDLPDVFQPPAKADIQTLVVNKWVQPLDGLLTNIQRFPSDVFVEGVSKLDGKIYTVPRVDPLTSPLLVYNKEVLKQAGLDPNKPPATWDELLDQSKKVTAAGKGEYYGLVLSLKDTTNGNGFGPFLNLASAAQPTLDGDGFDYQKGRYDLDSPNVTKAFEYFFQLKDAGVIHPNSGNLLAVDARGLFVNNKAAFMFGSFSSVRTTTIDNPKLSFGLAPMPVPQAGLKYRSLNTGGMVGFCISSTTKHPQEAAKLLDWITSTEHYQGQLKTDLLPVPIHDLYKDPNNYPNENFKQLIKITNDAVILRPIPESKPGAFEAKKQEAAIAKPKPDWQQILAGAYAGKVSDWKTEIKKVNDQYNQRFQQGIKKAQDKGAKVSINDFAFPDFDGTKNYQNK